MTNFNNIKYWLTQAKKDGFSNDVIEVQIRLLEWRMKHDKQ